jgi:hypothetical protein
MKNKPVYTRILFNRSGAFEILRYTSLHITLAGSLWIEALATEADIQTFKLNGWSYTEL